MESININSNINLYYIPMTKLKTTTIDVYIHRDLNEEESSLNALLPYVLKRGCRLCSDSEAISKYLENLYGAGVGVGVLKRGDDHILHVAFETISDKYAPNGEKLCDSVIDLMLSIMFESTSFSDEIVEQEKKNAKDRIMAMMNDASLCPLLEETKVGVSNYTKLPVTRLTAMGTAFQPLTTAVQTAVTGAGGSGLYYVNTAGKTMFQMKETGNFIGSLKTSAGLVGGGQAQMMPLAFDPTMLFMAAALANIDKKLDSIKEMQQEMMDFLVQKEKAELKGNLTFLYDMFNNYKYNWNNEMYKNSNHTMVLAIKKEAEAKIVFYREQIIAKVNKKSLIHSDQTVNKQLQAVQDQFKDYQLALYTLAFSSFLDVMLVGNYDKEYLSGISEKLDDYSMKYRELYTQCYEEISGYSSTSIQSSLLKGLSKTTKAVGKIVERIPVVGDTQADETLIAAGEKLGDIGTEKIRKQMRQLIERQSNFVRPFIDNIDTVNRLNNNPVQLLVDKDNLYIATIA